MPNIDNFIGVKSIKKNYKHVIRQVLAELLGSFLYISLVLSAGCNIRTNDIGGKVILIGLSNGLVVASVVGIIGHVSGGHINPAVTLGALICGRIRLLKALLYVKAQVTGSIAGAAVAYAVAANSLRGNLGATTPYSQSEVPEIFALEFLMTFLVVAVTLSVTDMNRGARGLGSGPLAIGLAITACICACHPYTMSMNPIRSLGPALMTNIWYDHWVYWVGPLAGGSVAGLVYRFLLSPVYKFHLIVGTQVENEEPEE
ncbi:aquaporin-like [Anticarsia gemmatalis]|uniref:aquaporin-like n=1 Tax=Anticarsia gemmatalis TaxID=129554 RepID=UPI003F7631A6